MKVFLTAFSVLTVLISSGYAQDTIHVAAGWNIIGSVKDGPIPDVLSTIPDSIIVSSFYGYDPAVGYEMEDTLGRGYGYWVKAKSDGMLVFNTPPAIDSCKSRAFVYQGKLYNTVKIGAQCWMAENLDAGTMIAVLTDQVDNDTLEKYCYDDDPLNCVLYGGLYQWDEAMQYATLAGAEGVCPPGWRLPSGLEFQALSSSAGSDGNALKAVGQGTGAGAGTNTSGFSVLLAGRRNYDGGLNGLGDYAVFWSSAENDSLYASYLGVRSIDGAVYTDQIAGKLNGFSVRCIEAHTDRSL